MGGRKEPRLRLVANRIRPGGRTAVVIEILIVIVAVLAVVRILQPPTNGARADDAGPATVAADIDGFARVIDGDTLDVDGVRVRLHGIDAFEGGQSCEREALAWACGAAAENHLRTLAQGRRVACEVRDTDRYGRQVAVCAVAGRDLGRAMVADGLAVAYRRYSMAYVGDELAARQRRAGAWRGSFDRPEQWRRRDRLNHAAN